MGDREQGHGPIGSPDHILLGPGRTFVAVSGLGGQSMRAFTLDHSADTWWASIYAREYQVRDREQVGSAAQIEYGALFIAFDEAADPHSAKAYFKTVDGQIQDRFTLESRKPTN